MANDRALPAILTVGQTAYTVLRLLGKGKGGYSYLVTDGTTQLVCKQIHHELCAYYQFGDKLAAELNDYQRLLAVGVPMPRLLAADRPRERLLKEYIPGETAYQLVLRDALPAACLAQMEQLCPRLYAAGLNIDYFPTNFVARDGQLLYVDYECNAYDPQWDFAHWGADYWRKSPAFLQYAAQQGDLPPAGK